jgi:hypothetical protein
MILPRFNMSGTAANAAALNLPWPCDHEIIALPVIKHHRLPILVHYLGDGFRVDGEGFTSDTQKEVSPTGFLTPESFRIRAGLEGAGFFIFQ